MRSVVLCYAPADAAFAHELRDFLELNCPVTVFDREGITRPGFDLVDAVERGLSSDLCVVLLSPESVPPVWARSKWEPVLIEKPRELDTPVAFLLLQDCKFPDLLRRKNFFDVHDRTPGLRLLKRWLLGLDAPFESTVQLPDLPSSVGVNDETIELLRDRIADRPGTAAEVNSETALFFAHTCKDDFEGVFWIDCAHRSPAGLLGDIGQTLGLRLPGSVQQNRSALAEFCTRRRALLVFDHVTPENRELLPVDGKTSFLFTAPTPLPQERPLADIVALFSSWPLNRHACLSALGEAQVHLGRMSSREGREWELTIQLGSAVTALLQHCERLAEAHEVLGTMADALDREGDRLASHRLRWEQSCLAAQWGERMSLPAPICLPDAAQLALDFV